ncbi:hypothetical protein O3M35_000373 [Rhynocoris fuscipes]|uniref:Nuclear RNA export factor 1 n=1 Tax=Rhynocoris fuscipes TaxID=488301 RepID=A0AAW1DLA8_9HEMI
MCSCGTFDTTLRMLNIMKEFYRTEFMIEVIKCWYSSTDSSAFGGYYRQRMENFHFYLSGHAGFSRLCCGHHRNCLFDYYKRESGFSSMAPRSRARYQDYYDRENGFRSTTAHRPFVGYLDYNDRESRYRSTVPRPFKGYLDYNKRENGFKSKAPVPLMECLGFEHDDRTLVPHDGTRRVSFKSHGRRNKNTRQRGWDNKIKAILQDEDVEMNAVSRNHDRYNSGGSRKIPRNFHRERITRSLPESPSCWYKVVIRYGARYEKDYILKLLGNYIKPVPFIPIGFKVTNQDISFVIEDHAAAEDLLNADRRITVSDGFKMSVQVRPFNPIVEIGTKMTEAMTKVMSSRYNAYNKALDISKFHLDSNFLAEGLFCPLNRENVMVAVINIINESIPDLVALDISGNKLSTLHYMKSIIEKVPNLKILHVGKNKLRDIKQLDVLKGLNLEELVLDGNSLCDKFSERDDYIRAVRQRFPRVIKLDFVDLPPPILFDVGDNTKLPPSQASFLCDPDRGASFVRAFLEQYYQIYDGDSRDALLQAYHDNAQFSLDCHLLPGDHTASFSPYLQDSRNLFRVSSLDRRIKLLNVGKNKIINTLRNLPKSQHDPASFVVDLVLFTPTLIELNVCGLFKEKDKLDTPVKYFNRVFIIVPVGTGFCIVNEQLTIMLAKQEQIKKVAKIKEASAAAAAAIPTPAVATVVPPLQVDPDIATKQQMVTALSVKSGMNLVWSEKCLAETNWNFDQALTAFMQLQKTGSIPEEAFQK